MIANRIVVVFTLPLCMLFGFLSVLIREAGRAFKYAWLEAMAELEAAKRYWR